MRDRVDAMNTIAVLEPGYADYGIERALLSEFGAKIVPIGEGENAIPALKSLDPVAVLVREYRIGQAELDACPNLKIVVRYGVGVDNIDIAYSSKRGIYIANVPDYGAENEVSEHALALYLAVQRRIVTRDAEVRAGEWGIGQHAPIPSRENAVLGLIGCGRIGIATAAKFQAIGFNRVIVHDPFLSDEAVLEAGVEKVALSELFSMADVVSLHAPLTPETHHILDGDALAKMKPTSIVVNVSRGGLVDEYALAEALEQGRIFGAGIDVFEKEPLRSENPLALAPNTVLTDHTAWYSERSVAVLQRNAAEEIARVLRGDPPKNWVNRW